MEVAVYQVLPWIATYHVRKRDFEGIVVGIRIDRKDSVTRSELMN